ncbi:MAG TPA: ferritin-like domain-containing protein, partial [Pirellulales bacterium]|nr:ferritin-like domain-containing protein [Pirellulales bacterium]
MPASLGCAADWGINAAGGRTAAAGAEAEMMPRPVGLPRLNGVLRLSLRCIDARRGAAKIGHSESRSFSGSGTQWEMPDQPFPHETLNQEKEMATKHFDSENAPTVTREDLVELLNEDLAREYQAIISYVVYSQVLKGAQYMNIAAELEIHAGQELQHALMIAKQIDYLGGMPKVTPKPVKTSDKAEDMLRFDLENENETIRNYRLRVRQC